jgi:hypothetical protein
MLSVSRSNPSMPVKRTSPQFGASFFGNTALLEEVQKTNKGLKENLEKSQKQNMLWSIGNTLVSLLAGGLGVFAISQKQGEVDKQKLANIEQGISDLKNSTKVFDLIRNSLK